MSEFSEIIIILRFRDLVTKENDTIKQHQEIIQQHGSVWWGWWKKGTEKTPVPELAQLGVYAKTSPATIYLVDSGQRLLYRASCINVEFIPNKKILSPETDKTPEYYRDQSYFAWFQFTEIESCDETELKNFSYVNCHDCDLFIDSNINYSNFNNKKIHSIAELIQQNRTIWFIRPAIGTDIENEIVLLNSEFIQPTHFSTKYYQSSGNVLLWLSDLHLSDKNNGFRDGTISQTLADHISQCIAKAERNPLKIGGLLISGDITFQAEEEGFDLARQFLKNLNNGLSTPVSSENIVLCPGNHDFTRESTNLPAGKDPDYIYNNPGNFSAYSEFYKSIYNIDPNKYFAQGRKLLLSSGQLLEIVALNSLILQQYPNFAGHGYISNEQLDFVAKQMGWDNSENQTSIRIVMMHHHYLPTCYTEAVEATRASSTVYDADRLMNWLVKYNVKLLLHGHKHKSFISQIDYPRQPEGNITIDNMHHIIVSAMGGTGASGVQNKFATICFEGNDVVIDFYNIYSNESEKDHRCQTIRLPL